mgnify:CR=1 FL=1
MNFYHSSISTILTAALIVASSITSGCAGKGVDETNPQSVFEDAVEDANDHRYAMALEKLKDVKNRFPYSSFAKAAQLKIADVHFEDESYVEAASGYETFRDLYPKHEKADYVIFRTGESYFNQLPSTTDRDLSPAWKAVESFRELRQLYPKSEFVEKSRSLEAEALGKLAEKERYIADFYFDTENYDSAARRYEKITTQFVGTPSEQPAYARWLKSLLKQNEIDAARHVYDTYVARHPNGEYSSEMKNAFDNFSKDTGNE